MLKIDQALVITTPQDIALIDAHKAISMFEKLAVPITGLVENMAYHSCSNCGHLENPFGFGGTDTLSVQRKVQVLERIPLNAKIREQADEGYPIAFDKKSHVAKLYKKIAQEIIEKTSL